MILFIIIFTVIYFISLCEVVAIYIDSAIDVTFWGICTVILPGVNTIVCITLLIKKHGGLRASQFFSFKRFLSDIDKI